MVDHQVMRLVRTMTKRQRLTMLRDVVQNMAERNNAEEIAAFLNAQCGGDDRDIATAYASLPD